MVLIGIKQMANVTHHASVTARRPSVPQIVAFPRDSRHTLSRHEGYNLSRRLPVCSEVCVKWNMPND